MNGSTHERRTEDEDDNEQDAGARQKQKKSERERANEQDIYLCVGSCPRRIGTKNKHTPTPEPAVRLTAPPAA